MRKTKKKKTTSGRKQSFLREEVAFLYACLLIKSRFREQLILFVIPHDKFLEV